MEKSEKIRKNGDDHIMKNLTITNLEQGDRLAIILHNNRRISPGDFVENVPRDMQIIINEEIAFSDKWEVRVKGYEDEDVTVRVRNAGKIHPFECRVKLPADVEVLRIEDKIFDNEYENA